MHTIDDLFLYSIGLIIAFILDAIWRKYFWGTFEVFLLKTRLDKYSELYFLAMLEHYHWGLLSIILYLLFNNDVLLGVGTGLVITEALQSKPFAIGSGLFLESTIIGLIEVAIIVLLILV